MEWISMVTEYSEIEDLMNEIDRHIKEKIKIFMIGGGALMWYNLKDYTKDIDIVLNSKGEYDILRNGLLDAGFMENIPGAGYERLSLSQIFTRDDFRIDVFCKEVCGKFSLSEAMMKRSLNASLNAKHIELMICSPGDILLFKTMTEREGDADDCVNIIKGRDLNWDAVINEAIEQSKSGNRVWITWISARLEYIAEIGVEIPILEKMMELAEEYIDEWERSLLENKVA